MVKLAPLTPEQRQILLKLAAESVDVGVNQGHHLSIEITDYPQALQVQLACFVTLHLNGKLRGCIGSLAPQKPLAEAVIDAAYNAALADSRFAAVEQQDASKLKIDISVLSLPETLTVTSESELLTKIRPGIDGLTLSEGLHQATFLPSVWQQLPQPAEFVKQLKLKAGFASDYWSNQIQVSRYTTDYFSA
ncbi:MAG: AmmeMemoRadiSam system protein A [Immundisolibacteraceae bacterium]|nr:AmmeMemoRadiSam system protein A [Immundisolibacteraceae bacterium]